MKFPLDTFFTKLLDIPDTDNRTAFTGEEVEVKHSYESTSYKSKSRIACNVMTKAKHRLKDGGKNHDQNQYDEKQHYHSSFHNHKYSAFPFKFQELRNIFKK